VNYLLHWGMAATQDPASTAPPPATTPEAPVKEKK